ncbi:hypothetical protein [Streptomyces montanisoli]|uniref:Integral membrane protein n=1 Tax=Streptomyces montanisoli TaxID=2798581 RepID=A0A940MD76_9ACTN|nr:hypothetical protein [Streptomyces montanisoli]MBP0460815.1 hypothetical protein [Streptomyces montanisoli]
MYGAVQPPPVRTRMSGVAAVALRVLLMVCSLGSIGLLAFVPLLRIAVLRRRWYDWALASVSLPGACVLLAVVGSEPEDSAATNIAMCTLLFIAVAVAVYFLVFDIRHHQRARAGVPQPYGGGPVPPISPAPAIPGYGYGYPPPYTPPAPPTPPAAPRTYAYRQPPPMPTAPPATRHPAHREPPAPQSPAHPAHPRIEQVRAELDELSDLLRKEQDGR